MVVKTLKELGTTQSLHACRTMLQLGTLVVTQLKGRVQMVCSYLHLVPTVARCTHSIEQ